MIDKIGEYKGTRDEIKSARTQIILDVNLKKVK